jgi:hypothetical protein
MRPVEAAHEDVAPGIDNVEVIPAVAPPSDGKVGPKQVLQRLILGPAHDKDGVDWVGKQK